MNAKSTFLLLLFASLNLSVLAQDKQLPQVDWEAKAIATELSKLGDPEINMFLPELYEALKQTQPVDAAISRPAAGYRKYVARTNMMSMLSNPSVRREIDMLDEQYEEIVARSQSIQSELTQHIGSVVLSSRDGINRDDVRRTIEEMREAAKKEIEKTVLPYQLKRLEQVMRQTQIRRQGAVEALVNDPLASQLGITDEQKDRLRERGREVEEKLARDIEQLRAKARDDLFAELKREQRQQLSKILGDEFRLEETKGSKNSPAKNAKHP